MIVLGLFGQKRYGMRSFFYIKMEFCARGSLHQPWEDVYGQLLDGDIVVLEDRNENPFVAHGGLSDAFGAVVLMDKVLSQILEALVFLESRGFAHLDLKPDNVFIDARGDLKNPRLWTLLIGYNKERSSIHNPRKQLWD
jgi:serine/threonine protein kinase